MEWADQDVADDVVPSVVVEHRAPTFVEFYAEHRDRLVRLLALDLRDLDLAVEAVDVGMARAWQHWERLDDRHDAGAWVYRVARNWATSWWRRRRRVTVGAVPDTAVEPTSRVEHDHVRDALERLSDPHRAVVVLRVHAGFSTTETAAALGIAEGTVKSRLARALDRLRADLGGDR